MVEHFIALPKSLELPDIQDRAVEIIRILNGLRAADAIAILENAQRYVLQASVAATVLIPLRNAGHRTDP
jgi:hypothetical protein